MSEPDHNRIVDAPMDASSGASPDFNALTAWLRALGADRFDPVRLHYIEALAKRASAHKGNTKRILQTKLENALAAYKERFALAQSEAKEVVEQSVQHYPHAANDLQRLFEAGDFAGLKRFVATLNSSEKRAALGALVRQLEEHTHESVNARPEGNAGARSELKAIRNFRATWSKLSVDKQVAQALKQAPKNAGPINSHMLMLRSLELMRAISPDYLNRFMTYADTLLRLDAVVLEKPGTPKKDKPGNSRKTQAARTAKK